MLSVSIRGSSPPQPRMKPSLSCWSGWLGWSVWWSWSGWWWSVRLFSTHWSQQPEEIPDKNIDVGLHTRMVFSGRRQDGTTMQQVWWGEDEGLIFFLSQCGVQWVVPVSRSSNLLIHISKVWFIYKTIWSFKSDDPQQRQEASWLSSLARHGQEGHDLARRSWPWIILTKESIILNYHHV